MKSFIKSLALCLACCVALTACDKKTDPTVTEQSFDSCYAIITDTQTQDVTVCTSVVFHSLIDWDNNLIDLDISGLTLDGAPLALLRFQDVAWKIENGWSTIASAQMTPVSSTADAPKVTNFNLRWDFRMGLVNLVGSFQPAVSFAFVLNDRYTVVGSRQPLVLGGDTFTNLKGSDEAKYHNTSMLYSVSLDFTRRLANVYLYGAKFKDAMPAMNMEFTEIPFAYDNNGSKITLVAGEVTPLIDGTPMSAFKITDFNATISDGITGTITFDCEVPRMGLYEVQANLNALKFPESME